MARINVSLPDELHHQIEGVRSRLNVSAVLQRALRQELARLQPSDVQVEASSEAVERLRQEKEQLETISRQRGFDTGLEWANRASYVDLRRWGELSVEADDLADLKTPPYDDLQWFWEADDLWGGTQEAEEFVKRLPVYKHLTIRYSDPWDSASHFYFDFGDLASFNAGFLDAVSKFWQSVKARL